MNLITKKCIFIISIFMVAISFPFICYFIANPNTGKQETKITTQLIEKINKGYVCRLDYKEVKSSSKVNDIVNTYNTDNTYKVTVDDKNGYIDFTKVVKDTSKELYSSYALSISCILGLFLIIIFWNPFSKTQINSAPETLSET